MYIKKTGVGIAQPYDRPLNISNDSLICHATHTATHTVTQIFTCRLVLKIVIFSPNWTQKFILDLSYAICTSTKAFSHLAKFYLEWFNILFFRISIYKSIYRYEGTVSTVGNDWNASEVTPTWRSLSYLIFTLGRIEREKSTNEPIFNLDNILWS